jgi:hypothetical protein
MIVALSLLTGCVNQLPSSPVCAVISVPLVSVKVSRKWLRPGDGETEGLGEDETLAEGDGEALGLLDGETLADGETDGDALDDGDRLGETLLLGDVEADGLSEGLTDGEPTDETLRISTTPPTFGLAVERVNEPLLTVVTASNT